MDTFLADLESCMDGEVLIDEVSLGIYSTDASNYQVSPVAVAIPRHDEDVRQAVATARAHGVTILPRGGGTSLAGQTVGPSLVIDFSKYMNRVLSLDVEARRVRVEPGIVREELNQILAPHGLYFAPDPATSNRANIGGMVGNNSSGTRSILYGKTVDHVTGMKVLLPGGETMDLTDLTAEEVAERASRPDHEGRILRGFRKIIDRNREEIEARFPKVMRRVAGYNLDEFLGNRPWNLSRLITGSEGTLAIIMEIELNLEPVPVATSIAIPHFPGLLEAIRAVKPILEHGPSAVEILDRMVIEKAHENLATSRIAGFLDQNAEAALIVEFFADSREEAASKAHRLASDLHRSHADFHCPVRLGRDEQQEVWEVRKAGLGLMLSLRGDRKPIPFIEDAAVPVDVLPEYVEQVLAICDSRKVDVAIYAHASVGVLHIRPILDLKRNSDIQSMKEIADEVFALVKQYGGAWSGEHGDGLVRSPFIESFFGPKITAAFGDVKRLFDPAGLMNPGKIVAPGPMDAHLRYGPAYGKSELEGIYRYPLDGSFGGAVEMCTGVGACRKTLGGTMCPSYRVTRDEQDSTRGRANALRLAMTGAFGPDGLTSKRLSEVLDLCISCKACKAECPSNVDLARLRAEVLQHMRDVRGGSRLRDRLAAGSPAAASHIAGPLALLLNPLLESPVIRRILEQTVGFDRRRVLPRFARTPLSDRLLPDGRRTLKNATPVVLFDDTYMNFHEPHVGEHAVALLESFGYQVTIARAGCCQRPRISHGFLREAREDGGITMKALDRFARRGWPIVTCEPGCASALVDDLPDLIEDRELGSRVAAAIVPIDIFLDREFLSGRTTASGIRSSGSLHIHGHCHQKALFGMDAMTRLLRAGGAAVEEIDSGCCGMAGSFGYEKEHYDLSMQIGEDRLFPAVREAPADALIVAPGFSCRHQIEHATGRRAVHWVEALRGMS